MMDANGEQILTVSPSSDCVSATAVSPLDVGTPLSEHNRFTAQCEQYATAFAFLQNNLAQSNAQNQIFIAEIARLNHHLKEQTFARMIVVRMQADLVLSLSEL